MADNQFLIVIGLDIEGYTNKPLDLQYDAQSTLEQWVVESCAFSQIATDPNNIVWIDTGDGGFLLFETTYRKALPFLERFYAQLHQHNRKSKESAAINVRAAVHCADSIRWNGKLGLKFSGSAVNVCARLLNGMSREYANQVVASRDFLEKVSHPEPAVSALRLPDYVDKHGIVHEVWNIRKQPGFGITPNEEDLNEDVNEWEFPS